ncbi:MAG: hypothetical protein KC420_01980 [Myxococcales bacterium]|nr:hypothetical protein [Myxococcales bacterium]MCB9566897.1 hypothetical protein [Myxococcales bacterium]MCB9704629.1 hypothetical protein [Myxococcales bacterium]
MRRITASLSLLSALALALPACGGTSGGFRGNGTGVPADPAKVQVVRSKDDLSAPYKELGVARAKAPSAQEAVDLAKRHCAQGGGGDLLIMNTEPFQSGDTWRVDATCALSEGGAASQGGGKSAGGKPSGSGKPIH